MKKFIIISFLSFILIGCSSTGKVYNLKHKINYLKTGMSKKTVINYFRSEPVYHNKFGKEILMFCDVYQKDGNFFREVAAGLTMQPYTWYQIYFKNNKLLGYDLERTSGLSFYLINGDCNDRPPPPDWSLFPE